MLLQITHSPKILQIRKVVVSPEDWDGDIWGDSDDSKPELALNLGFYTSWIELGLKLSGGNLPKWLPETPKEAYAGTVTRIA